MKKMNNKGFVLVETLIVTVFVVAIFSIIFMNFYPLIGEYERRENYDDVDSKYGVFWIKRMIQESNYNIYMPSSPGTPLGVYPYVVFREIDCNTIFSDNEEKLVVCNNLFDKLDIKKVIVTTYNLTDLKKGISEEVNLYGFQNLDDGLKDYIEYLPKYTYDSLNGAKYRVIVEFERTITDEVGEEETYNTYATMEVLK